METPNNEEINKEIEIEDKDWVESLDDVYNDEGGERVITLLDRLQVRAKTLGVNLPIASNTPFQNSISRKEQPPFPGDRQLERRIKSINRWNAMAMVVRANRRSAGIGGHISTYASSATLFEVAFNHFLRAHNERREGDLVYFQGHASPGIYARAFLEGRLSEADLDNFRRELNPGGGLSSYPHPRLMPNFWEYPTVSMGLASIMAIYQARFNQYLEDRGLKEKNDQKIWAFLGDGELDEPESLGAITLPPREKLDNLIFVVNCNLQRLDGPVRGNGKIIQELEAAFKGAGWNVIKVIWGDDWDPLLKRDKDGFLARRMDEILDGQLQKYIVSGGDFIRQDFFGKYPELLKMVEDYTDEQLRTLRRGGHDPDKVYAAYNAAVNHTGSPTIILAMTVKGYGLGEAGEGRNITHQQKKLNEDELKSFRTRFDIPISDDDIADAPFYRPDKNSPEMKYLLERRKALGGFLPERKISAKPLTMPGDDIYAEFAKGTDDREVATTMVMVHLLSKLLDDEKIGKYIVPIVPDEARTFGMESLFRKAGIYSHVGQLYEPVDIENLMYYKEAINGQILEEGITEAGAMSSFIAAGTSHTAHNLNMMPMFLYYSMFGFQRIGDLIWAAIDSKARGFLVGCTAGRSTLAGEGLQHQDGHSHQMAYAYPNLKAYDPAYAYELAVIVREGLHRMYELGEDLIYYITVMNEFYKMPPMPKGVEEGILKGIYKFRKSDIGKSGYKAHLLGSGAILNEAVKAQEILEKDYNIATDVWSVTSYKELYINATDTERNNMLKPSAKPEKNYLETVMKGEKGSFVAVSDYLKALPNSISRWLPGRLVSLGTDGFGRSESRQALRDYYGIDARHIAAAALYNMYLDKQIKIDLLEKAYKDLDIDPNKPNPYMV